MTRSYSPAASTRLVALFFALSLCTLLSSPDPRTIFTANALPVESQTQPILSLYDMNMNPIEPSGKELELSQARVRNAVGDNVIRMVHPELSEDEITLPMFRKQQLLQDTAEFTVYGTLNSSGIVTNISEFQVTIENPNTLPNCQPAIQAAFQVVANGWTSSIPVRVRVHFEVRQGFLAFARPSLSYLKDNVFYPSAIYDFITGKDNDVNSYDIDIEINPSASWSVVDGTLTATTYDLQSVMIHESQHGLYLVSNYQIDANNGQGKLNGGKQTVFDLFVAVNPVNTTSTEKVCGVLGYFDGNVETTSKEVQQSLTSNRLFFFVDSTVATGYYNLYAPQSFAQGSSVIHWDPFLSSQFDNCDDLMFYQINPGVELRCIGKITARISFACRTVGLENSNIVPPTGCPPGSFGNGGADSGGDDKIAGLDSTVFYAIVGGVGGVILISIICLVGTCIKKSRKPKKRDYGYMSPGGYQSPGSAYGDYQGGYYGSGRLSPYGGGSPGGYPVPPGGYSAMMSPTAHSPRGRTSGYVSAGSAGPGSVPRSPRAKPPQSPRGSGMVTNPYAYAPPPGHPVGSGSPGGGTRTPGGGPARSPGGSGRVPPPPGMMMPPPGPHSPGSGRMQGVPPPGPHSPGSGRIQGVPPPGPHGPGSGRIQGVPPPGRTSGRIPGPPGPPGPGSGRIHPPQQTSGRMYPVPPPGPPRRGPPPPMPPPGHSGRTGGSHHSSASGSRHGSQPGSRQGSGRINPNAGSGRINPPRPPPPR